MTEVTTSRDTAEPAGPAPTQLGIGMRFSLHPHCEDFVPVILGALADVRATGLDVGLVIETDEVSTYVGARTEPAEQQLVAYLAGVLAAASRRTGGGHVVAHVLLSRGCPGEVSCDLAETGLPTPAPVEVAPTGVPAVAQWSLYPLMDAGTESGDHMAPIEAAIASARRRGTAVAPSHYATKLTGDVSEVLATAADAWAGVGAQVPHVVTHLTVSVGSPSTKGGDA